MEITVFAKKMKTKTGKDFYKYLTTLKKKDGTEDTMQVKFREECGTPKNFPCNLVVEKGNANIATKTETREDTGDLYEAKTLWITAWSEGEPYVDTSLDEYEL